MKATYIDHMGSDARVVDSARVSFKKLAENYTQEQNEKLLKYLARHNHWTPFSHPQITIHEKVPIFVARQRFKHMVGFTYNEVSRRYVNDDPEFFIPSEWRSAPENAKQGSSNKIINEVFYNGSKVSGYGHPTKLYQELLNASERLYKSFINSDVAPEQARMVLPQSMYTEYYVTGSLAAWARAYKQRIDAHAQKEIQDLAVQWDEIIRPLYPVSWSVLVGNSLV